MNRRRFVQAASGLFVPAALGRAQSIVFPGPGVKAYSSPGFALVSNLGQGSSDANGFTSSSSINTTGASLLVVVASWYPGSTANVVITDSKNSSGDWTGLTARTVGGTKVRIFYVQNPIVGTGHTFTVAGASTYVSIFAAAFSGAALSGVFDTENGATDAGGAFVLQTGSISPSVSNCLVVAGMSGDGSSITIGSSMSITNSRNNLQDGGNSAGALAWKVHTSGAINPQWSWTTNAGGAAAAIASFKPA